MYIFRLKLKIFTGHFILLFYERNRREFAEERTRFIFYGPLAMTHIII